MREKESAPLLANGFKDITEADLHTEFVQPFNQGHDHRTNLLLNLGQYLNQFKELGLQAELWIDGSFATTAPDPSDIDIVFYFRIEDIDNLTPELKERFERLLIKRKFMRNLYRVDVHYAEIGNNYEYDKWIKVFGTGYDNVTPKGIFRIYYN